MLRHRPAGVRCAARVGPNRVIDVETPAALLPKPRDAACGLMALLPHIPRPPSPPALVTAAASAGVLALPIGACRIGHLRFSLSVKVLIDHIRVYSQSFASIRIPPKQHVQQRRAPA